MLLFINVAFANNNEVSNKEDVIFIAISEINSYRNNYELNELRFSYVLSQAAYIRAKESSIKFEYSRLDNSSPKTLLVDEPSYFGENLAMSTNNVLLDKQSYQVINAFMQSKLHRVNILNKRYTKIGINFFIKDNTTYWCFLFSN